MTCFKISKVAGLALCADTVFALAGESKEDSLAETDTKYEVPYTISRCDHVIEYQEGRPTWWKKFWHWKHQWKICYSLIGGTQCQDTAAVACNDCFQCQHECDQSSAYGSFFTELKMGDFKGCVLSVKLPKTSFPIDEKWKIGCAGSGCDNIDWQNVTSKESNDHIYNFLNQMDLKI